MAADPANEKGGMKVQPLYEKKSRFTEAVVAEQYAHGQDGFTLRIYAPDIAEVARPGEFVMIKGWSGDDPLLPRPFSFGRIGVEPGTFDLFYRIVGRGTHLMSLWKKGDRVSVLAPLGHAWPLPEPSEQRDVVLVGRGLGIAPLVCLAEEAVRRNLRVFAYLSGRNKVVMLGAPVIEDVAHYYVEVTDDKPKVARVTELLEDDLRAEKLNNPCVYTCGSNRLARHIQELERDFGLDAFISIETHMACGYGACKGCVHPMVHPDDPNDFVYERACLEGSIFPLRRVILP